MNLVMLVIVCFIALLPTTSRTQWCGEDVCDCSIWDQQTRNGKGVRNIFARCSEGEIRWNQPFGGLRIQFHHFIRKGPIEVCFLIQANFTTIKISEELPNSLHPLMVVNSSHETPEEYCVTSAPSSEEMILFLEPDVSSNAFYFSSAVKIRYAIDPVSEAKAVYYKVKKYHMEECRPCTDDELLMAYCSSDYVLEGQIESVSQLKKGGPEVALNIKSQRILRQSKTRFKRAITRKSKHSDSVLPRSGTASRKVHYHGAINVGAQCNVLPSDDIFLFVGREKLGRVFLKCAPTLQEWSEVKERAYSSGRHPCLLH